MCSYQAGQEPDARAESEEHNDKRVRLAPVDQPIGNTVQGARQLLNTSTSAPLGIIEDLQNRVKKLEQVLQPEALTNGTGVLSKLDTDNEFYVDRFGAFKAFSDARVFMRKLHDGDEDSEISQIGQELRHVYRSVKSHHKRRKLQHVLDYSQVLEALPDHASCERLIDLYFDNLEHCFRILHRPTFDAQFKDFRNLTDIDQIQRSSFLPQLVAVVASGSIIGTHPECNSPGLSNLVQGSAKFIQAYLDGLSSKEIHTLPALQTKMVLMMLKWILQHRMSELWLLNGQILRLALIMGLDKDPNQLPNKSVLQTEIRRRLWCTIAETDMMLSILCKMPCMVPTYTSRSPLNVNDAEIFEGLQEFPQSRPITEWTDGLCQFILAQSLRQRIAACKDMYTGTPLRYQEVLKNTRCLEQVLQTLPAPLRFNHTEDEEERTAARLMARMELDISIRRPLLQLYSPFAYAMAADDSYKEARLGFFQSCMMLTTYQDLFDPKFSELNVPQPEGYWDFFYNVYREELNQATLGLCLEVKRFNDIPIASTPSTTNRLNDNSTNSGAPIQFPPYTKANVIHTIKDIIEPMTRRITHPGANLKDLAYVTIVFNSVRVSPTTQEKQVKDALQDLITACKTQFNRDGIPLLGDLSRESTDGGSSAFGEGINEFDPSWVDFPDLNLDFGIAFDDTSAPWYPILD